IELIGRDERKWIRGRVRFSRAEVGFVRRQLPVPVRAGLDVPQQTCAEIVLIIVLRERWLPANQWQQKYLPGNSCVACGVANYDAKCVGVGDFPTEATGICSIEE